MQENVQASLNKFYQNLHTNIIKKKKKVKENSIIIAFLDSTSNDRYKLLNESAISAHKIPSNTLTELENKNFVRNTDILNHYTITAKGIWEIETKNDLISEQNLINYLDQKLFNVYNFSNKPLSDKQKVIIFSMLAARTFSEKSSIDLKIDDNILNVWEEIVEKSYEKLNSLKLISKLEKKDLYGKAGTEHPVSNLYRHTDELPKKTKGIFKALGKQKYFLDIFKDSEISNENLNFLFNLIFDKNVLSSTEIYEISNFCNDIASNKNIYIFDPREHIFLNPKYDGIIRDVLLFHK